MIFFTSVNDISRGSKFQRFVVENKKPVWGITELSSATFNRIKKGDHVLFYFQGRIIFVCEVSKTVVDRKLSGELFGTYNHFHKGTLHWSNLIYFSKSGKFLDISFQKFISVANYSPKYSIRRLISLNQTGMNYVKENYKTELAFIESLNNQEMT